MADFEQTTEVDASAEALFDYLSDVRHLPAYFDGMTSAEPAAGEAVRTTARIDPDGEGEREVEGEAWFRVDEDEQTLAWGSEGPNDYRGELEVSGSGDGSTVTVRLHTVHAGADAHDGIDEGLRTSLANVKHLVEGG